MLTYNTIFRQRISRRIRVNHIIYINVEIWIPQDIKWQLFSVILIKNHVFLAFDQLRDRYFQIDINYIVLLLIVTLFFNRKWYYIITLNN